MVMAGKFKKIKSYKFTEEEMRAMWKSEYCNTDIFTFDEVKVKFFEKDFDHCFFESSGRKKGDKSIFSLNRLEKMLWIKDALQSPDAILKKGWDKKKKKYFDNRRVAVVKNNYVVIIVFTGLFKANFVTAYEKNDIQNILKAPDFEKCEKYFGK
jgi:hypothetical protein